MRRETCFLFNNELTLRKNGVNIMELKQIGPRLRKEVYDFLCKDCENLRMSQSQLIEMLIIKYGRDKGHEFSINIGD